MPPVIYAPCLLTNNRLFLVSAAPAFLIYLKSPWAFIFFSPRGGLFREGAYQRGGIDMSI